MEEGRARIERWLVDQMREQQIKCQKDFVTRAEDQAKALISGSSMTFNLRDKIAATLREAVTIHNERNEAQAEVERLRTSGPKWLQDKADAQEKRADRLEALLQGCAAALAPDVHPDFRASVELELVKGELK